MDAAKVFLVVDDEVDIREILVEELKFSGMKVLEASGGHEAVEILKNNSVDFVITDIRMSDGDGIYLTQYIKRNISNPPKVCLISGFADSSPKDSYHLGAESYIGKPFLLQHVIDESRRLLLSLSERFTLFQNSKNELIHKLSIHRNLDEGVERREIVFGSGGFCISAPIGSHIAIGSLVLLKGIDFEMLGWLRWIESAESSIQIAGIEWAYLEPSLLEILYSKYQIQESQSYIPKPG